MNFNDYLYESLINKGLPLNINAINQDIMRMFRKFSISYRKIVGKNIYGGSQIRQTQDV